MTTSSKWNLAQGTVVTGRWKGGRYVVQRLLGQGANGIVYLVKHANTARLYAMKLGFDTLDLQSEINVLKAVQRARSRSLGENRNAPYLVEVDDYTLQGREIPFYVMRYVKGEPLRAFLAHKGGQWLHVAGLHLLQQLRALHEAGWAFGDLKPENVLVSPSGEVELIDYGGVSAIGKSIKQYTEWYDRGFWNAGSRTAESSYDWFSFAVVCIHLLAEGPLKRAAQQLPQTRGRNDLLLIVQSEAALAPFRSWLELALRGEFRDTTHACQLWKKLVTGPYIARRTRVKTPGWMVGAFALSLTLLGCALYLSLRF